MTIEQLEERLAALEKKVELISSEKDKDRDFRAWLDARAGRFKDDPAFEEILKLGREYRQSHFDSDEDNNS